MSGREAALAPTRRPRRGGPDEAETSGASGSLAKNAVYEAAARLGGERRTAARSLCKSCFAFFAVANSLGRGVAGTPLSCDGWLRGAMAEGIVLALGAWFGVGAAVALLFLIFGVSRVDAAAEGAGWAFRPMIFLGCVMLFPVVLARWLSGRRINEAERSGE